MTSMGLYPVFKYVQIYNRLFSVALLTVH